jgi:Tol biopolymer transport system component
MNADGSKPTRLIGSKHNEIAYAWSADSTRIYFAGDERREQHYELYVMNADGGGVTRLSPQLPPEFTSAVTWSPDRRHVAVTRMPTYGHTGIYVATIDLSDMYRISDDTADDAWPVWSPR